MEKMIYQGKFIQVSEEKIANNLWERVYLRDGVLIFPLDHNQNILMIEERRPHEKNPIRLKFVTGLIDDGEEALETAKRELQEEIGLKPNKLEILFSKESNGTVNNKFYQILATDLVESKLPNPDGEDTIVSVKAFSISEVERMFDDGTLELGLPYIGLLKLKKLLNI